MATINLIEVNKLYRSGGTDVLAIEDLSFGIQDKELVSLVGPSGCGKTTLVNLIAGFILPTKGKILIDQTPVAGPSASCGVVFQADSVFPWMTVTKNVGYGLRFNGTPKSQMEQVVKKYLDLVGLTRFADAWPRNLSGGMKKRVDLARAYSFDPQLLLMDEPFGSLDVLTKEEMQILLLRVWSEQKKTILFVTHDVEEAIFLGQRVIVMTPRPGTIKQVFSVPFPLPRDSRLKLSSEFVNLRRQVVEALVSNGRHSDTEVNHHAEG